MKRAVRDWLRSSGSVHKWAPANADQGGDALGHGFADQKRNPSAHAGPDQDLRPVRQAADRGDGVFGPVADGAVQEIARALAVARIVEPQKRAALFACPILKKLRFGAGHVRLEAAEPDDARTRRSGWIGGTAADHIYGNAIANVLEGRDGSDYLFGDAGNDTLIGDDASDTMSGGAGNDSFVILTGVGIDRLLDWSEGDIVDVSAFGLAGFGALVFADIVGGQRKINAVETLCAVTSSCIIELFHVGLQLGVFAPDELWVF
mgnify:CR=1 FL=1